MFFIVSYETAHTVVIYAAVGIAIVLTIMALTMSLIKKRKIMLPRTLNKPVISDNKAPVIATPTINNQKNTKNPENNNTEQENPLAKPQIIQPAKQSTTQILIQPSTLQNSVANQETAIKTEDLITCPSGSEKKLIGFCPYCNHTLDREQKITAQEDLWKKYFKI